MTDAPSAASWRAISAPSPLDAPVTTATFPESFDCMVAPFRWGENSIHRLEIRVQDDPVTGLAGGKSGEGLVDLAHREVLGLRQDIMTRSEVEHRRDRHWRAGRRTGD